MKRKIIMIVLFLLMFVGFGYGFLKKELKANTTSTIGNVGRLESFTALGFSVVNGNRFYVYQVIVNNFDKGMIIDASEFFIWPETWGDYTVEVKKGLLVKFSKNDIDINELPPNYWFPIVEGGNDNQYYRGYNDGYTSGYDVGNLEGYNRGYLEGYNIGYIKGYDEGYLSIDQEAIYNNGYNDGYTSLDPTTIYDNAFAEGRIDGYTDGYLAGITESNTELGFWEIIPNTVSVVWNDTIEPLFDYSFFGVKLMDIWLGFVGIAVSLFLLRWFMLK